MLGVFVCLFVWHLPYTGLFGLDWTVPLCNTVWEHLVVARKVLHMKRRWRRRYDVGETEVTIQCEDLKIGAGCRMWDSNNPRMWYRLGQLLHLQAVELGRGCPMSRSYVWGRRMASEELTRGPEIVGWPVSLSQRSTGSVLHKWEAKGRDMHPASPTTFPPNIQHGQVRLCWTAVGGPSAHVGATFTHQVPERGERRQLAPPHSPSLRAKRRGGDHTWDGDFKLCWTRPFTTENYPTAGARPTCYNWNGTWKPPSVTSGEEPEEN